MREVTLSTVEASVEESKRETRYSYRTSSELAFIRGLVRPTVAKPLEAVKKYREALEKRTDWTGINRSYVFEYIDAILAKAGRW